MQMRLCNLGQPSQQHRFYKKPGKIYIKNMAAQPVFMISPSIKKNIASVVVGPSRKIKFHDVAVEISKREKGKKETDIAQICEVLKNALDILGEEWAINPQGINNLLAKRKPKSPK